MAVWVVGKDYFLDKLHCHVSIIDPHCHVFMRIAHRLANEFVGGRTTV
jgi:hypothetical protein